MTLLVDAGLIQLQPDNSKANEDPYQVDPDQIIQQLHDLPSRAHRHHQHINSAASTITPYSSRYASQAEVSKFVIPQEGAPADAVHQMLKDELDLDGRPNLNLASFVGTYMEREAEKLIVENLSKNMSVSAYLSSMPLLTFTKMSQWGLLPSARRTNDSLTCLGCGRVSCHDGHAC